MKHKLELTIIRLISRRPRQGLWITSSHWPFVFIAFLLQGRAIFTRKKDPSYAGPRLKAAVRHGSEINLICKPSELRVLLRRRRFQCEQMRTQNQSRVYINSE